MLFLRSWGNCFCGRDRWEFCIEFSDFGIRVWIIDERICGRLWGEIRKIIGRVCEWKE